MKRQKQTAMTTPPVSNTTKPYNIALVGENDAEINMYGEVVDARPVDWWTGQPIEGNFIALDEFLRDLDELSTKDNITVHINSVGGDLYAGVAIYNRLKALKANVTTINDGLAASAGSVIFQAGNTRKVNAGSNVMIHGALGFLFGYYNVRNLKDAIKQLDAGTMAAVNIYAEATGRDADSIKALVDKETWMTGQDAVDKGFADEVIDNGVAVSMSLTADKSRLMVNGVAMNTVGLTNIPANIPVSAAAYTPAMPTTGAPVENIENQPTGGKDMEIKNKDDLRAAYPDFVAELEAEAQASGNAAGVAAERARIQGIEAIEAAVSDASLVNAAKYGDKPLTAEQLALQAMQAQAALGNKMLGAMAADATASGANGVGAVPNAGTEPTDAEKAKAAEAAAVNMIVGNRAKKEAK